MFFCYCFGGYNQKLSLRRAQAVKSYLVHMGVDDKNIYVEGKGEANPVASNKTSAGTLRCVCKKNNTETKYQKHKQP